MPFTLSHAAAALPFRKLKPIWPALVIGTFAPDFQYLLHLSDESRAWHQMPDLLTLAFPAAVLVFWLFEYFVRDAVIELLPRGVQQRLPTPRHFALMNWACWPGIVGWIAVGLATHIAWDSVTHSTTWTFEHWALLGRMIPIPFRYPMPLYKILQHGSSLLGLALLAIWVWRWYRQTAPVVQPRARELSTSHKAAVLLTIGVIALAAGVPLAVKRFASFDPPIEHKYLLITLFEAIALMICVQLVVYGIARSVARPERSPGAAVNEHSQ